MAFAEARGPFEEAARFAATFHLESGFLDGARPLVGARDAFLAAWPFFGAARVPFLERARISFSDSGLAEELRVPFLASTRAGFPEAEPAFFVEAPADGALGAVGRSLCLTRAALDGAS